MHDDVTGAAAGSPRLQRLAAEVAAIEALDLEGLREAWSQTIGRPPKLRSPGLLRLHLAWRVQADALGGLDAGARRSLRKVGGGSASDDRPPVGSVLSREWLGVIHQVTVAEKSFLYQGRAYRSLSVIAREITGARWSGPRFFGLRSDPKAKGRAP